MEHNGRCRSVLALVSADQLPSAADAVPGTVAPALQMSHHFPRVLK